MMGNPNSEGDAHAHNPGCLPRAAMMLLRHFDCDAVVVVVFRGAKPELASVSKAGAEWAALVWLVSMVRAGLVGLESKVLEAAMPRVCWAMEGPEAPPLESTASALERAQAL